MANVKNGAYREQLTQAVSVLRRFEGMPECHK